MSDNKVYVLMLKTKMLLDHIFNSYLSYIYTDVIKTEIEKLEENFNKINDFELLRKKINTFCENIYN